MYFYIGYNMLFYCNLNSMKIKILKKIMNYLAIS